MVIDPHTHSSISDGTDSIPELISAAKAAGIDVLGLTDHDTMIGVEEAQELGGLVGIEVLRGMELSAHIDVNGSEESVHLLAYGCVPDHDELNTLLNTVCEARRARVPRMLELLAQLGMPLELSEVKAQSRMAAAPGRPHVADAMVARGYVVNRDQAFEEFLYESGPAYVKRYSPTIFEAVDLVNKAHGVAVLAHPWGRGNREVTTAEVIADLRTAHGLYGIEVDHVDHLDEERELLRHLAHDLGLVATGSSDYHGTGKTRNPLGVHRTTVNAYQAIRAEIKERGGQL